MHTDVVTTVLELTGVLLLALGLGMMTTAAVGAGLMGYGAGVVVAALTLAAVSVVLHLQAPPVLDGAGRRR